MGATSPPRCRALLVEDEFLVSLDLAALIEDCGIEVVGPAARLAEGVRLAEQETGLSVGILDVNLAGEKSWPVARALRDRGIPWVFVTGYIEAHAQVPPDLAGSRVLPKPVDAAALGRTLAQMIAGSGQR